jgi:hypothetical protein
VIGVRTESDIGLVTSFPVGPLVPIDRGAATIRPPRHADTTGKVNKGKKGVRTLFRAKKGPDLMARSASPLADTAKSPALLSRH